MGSSLWLIMNPDYQIVWLICVTKNNVSLITGEDGNGKITAEAMITAKLRSYSESHWDMQQMFKFAKQQRSKQERPIWFSTTIVLRRHLYNSFQCLSSYLWLRKCGKIRQETASLLQQVWNSALKTWRKPKSEGVYCECPCLHNWNWRQKRRRIM